MRLKKLLKRYSSSSNLGKFFVWYSVFIAIAIVIIYVSNVLFALNMDQSSYNCTHDTIMKSTCDDPFGMSIFWTIVGVVFLGGPFIIAWIVLGIVLKVRQKKPKR